MLTKLNTLAKAGQVCGALILAFVFCTAARAEDGKPDSLDVVKKNLADKKAILLDVREQDEWNNGHLQAANLFSLSKLKEGADPKAAIPDAAKPGTIVYCHCFAGKRAATAAEMLRKKGYDARPIKEGYETLLKSGFEKAK